MLTPDRIQQLDDTCTRFASDDGLYRIELTSAGYEVFGPSGLVGVRHNLKHAIRLAHEDRNGS